MQERNYCRLRYSWFEAEPNILAFIIDIRFLLCAWLKMIFRLFVFLKKAHVVN